METRTQTLNTTFATTSTWVAISTLLMSSVVLDVATSTYYSDSAVGLLGPLARAAAMLLVVIRLTGRIGSRPIRASLSVSLVGLAIWMIARELTIMVLDTGGPLPAEAILILDVVLFVSLSIVAVGSFARSGLAPHPIRWGPAWAVAILCAGWILNAVTLRMPLDPQAIVLTESILTGSVVATSIGLGVIALLLAVRSESGDATRAE